MAFGWRKSFIEHEFGYHGQTETTAVPAGDLFRSNGWWSAWGSHSDMLREVVVVRRGLKLWPCYLLGSTAAQHDHPQPRRPRRHPASTPRRSKSAQGENQQA